MTQTFTKDNTVLAKLFAEEDIHVVHRQAHTASFDVKKRELVLPILKFMSKDIQDLMTLHEVGHAFWTTVDMMRETSERKIHHSIVNILEDVRIEKMIQEKYKGSKVIFKRGYQELIKNNFFETYGKDINSYNLIDRINLHFKHHENVEFSDDEMVWVKKADATKTCAEVLDLAEELHTFMKEQQESQESMTDMNAMSAPSDGEFCFDLLGSSFDTSLAIKDEFCDVELACDGDGHGSAGGYASYTSAALTSGQVVTIVIDSYSSTTSGAFVLSITEGACSI